MISEAAVTVVGTGIRSGCDLTPEAAHAIGRADHVFFLAADPISAAAFLRLRPDAESVAVFYGGDVERRVTYERMVDRVLECVRSGKRVCFAIPGHPGVFAQPTHEVIRRARAEGYSAIMLPAISAADHLYADLGIDPGEAGSVDIDATDFLLEGRVADPTMALVLWQVGVIAERCYPDQANRLGLTVLAEVLLETYAPDHAVAIYEAASLPMREPIVRWMRLDALARADVPLLATLYVPPARRLSIDLERARRLGLTSGPTATDSPPRAPAQSAAR